jgi:hypothetical protein
MISIICFAKAPLGLTPKEAEVYTQHQDEINFFTKFSVEDQMTEFSKKYNLADNYYNEVWNLVNEREIRLNAYNFIYPDSLLLRFQAKEKVKNQYNTSITRQLLLAGVDATTENLNSVLRIKDVLKLTKLQVDTIAEKAINLNGLLQRHPHIDLWAHELSILSKTLSTEQMDLFLSYKNSHINDKKTKNVWSKLKANNMTDDLDSIQEYNKLYAYYNEIYKTADLYSENDSLKREVWKAIDLQAPVSLKRYNTIKNKKGSSQTYNGTYIW